MRRSLNRYSFRRSVVILLCILFVFYIMATVYGYYSWQACSQEREKLDERLSLYEKKYTWLQKSFPKERFFQKIYWIGKSGIPITHRTSLYPRMISESRFLWILKKVHA